MKAKDIVALIEELFAELIDDYYELVDVEFGSGRNGAALRVYVDREGGITADDCQHISKTLAGRLDELDPIATSYEFEVSSPGIERPLRKLSHFRKVVGSKIRVNTYGPIDGRKNFIGELVALDEAVLKMSIDGRVYMIPLEQVSKANVVYEF